MTKIDEYQAARVALAAMYKVIETGDRTTYSIADCQRLFGRMTELRPLGANVRVTYLRHYKDPLSCVTVEGTIMAWALNGTDEPYVEIQPNGRPMEKLTVPGSLVTVL